MNSFPNIGQIVREKRKSLGLTLEKMAERSGVSRSMLSAIERGQTNPTFSLWGATNGGGNLIMHGTGWMEGGLSCNYEKIVLDLDLLQMVAELSKPVTVEDDDLAIEAIKEVGPSGHFFGVEHTQSRYKSAFYAPILSDWRNFESWHEAGSPTALEKANQVWKERLAQYEKPAIDPTVEAALQEYIAKRKAEGGVATDF